MTNPIASTYSGNSIVFCCFCLSVQLKYQVNKYPLYIAITSDVKCRSQWPRGLRRGSAAAHLLRLWFRIPPGAWMSVCCECCVLSGRGLCDELITRPEESYRLSFVVVCDLQTSLMRKPWPTGGGGVAPKRNKLS